MGKPKKVVCPVCGEKGHFLMLHQERSMCEVCAMYCRIAESRHPGPEV